MNTNRNEIGKLGLMLGAALVISGLVRYSVQGLWGFNLWLVIIGALLLVAGLALNFESIKGTFTSRTGKLGTNMGVLTIAVIGILALANFLGYRHHKRLDLTSEQLYSLSEQTRKVAAALPKDVKIVKFDKQEDTALKDLMEEYKGAGRRITYELVDPGTKPEVAKQYKATAYGDTFVAAGDRTEKLEAGQINEQAITNAILKVTRDKLKTICFTEGHGEKSLTSADQQGGGFSSVDKKLKAENYETKTINMVTGGGTVPAECAVLIVAGPKQGFLPPEASAVGKYLDGGGKAFLMLDPETDPQLDSVLKAWNVVLGNNTVLDFNLASQLFGGGGPVAPAVQSYGSHPITQGFNRSMTIFPYVREVKVGSASNSGVNTQSLLTTSESSWGETEIKPNVQPKFDGADTKGPVNIGVVGSKSLGENKEARLVVIGDSDFASDGAIRAQRNGDLFLNCVNWLAQDEDLIAIRPKSATSRSVTMSEGQQRMFFWFSVALLPLLVMGTGAYVWWKRR
ncbi:MAG: GldG family protein [Acidobacteria bacterium]|nr:GldG family protein [Acidobacteriota bacterium]MBI3426058.1 GldG family protein [Acidobacteriota bacterium]